MGKLGGPSPINRGRLYRMTHDYIAPMEPTFAALGPSPISIEQGVCETVEWLRQEYPEFREDADAANPGASSRIAAPGH